MKGLWSSNTGKREREKIAVFQKMMMNALFFLPAIYACFIEKINMWDICEIKKNQVILKLGISFSTLQLGILHWNEKPRILC